MPASSVLLYGFGILKRSRIPESTNEYPRKDFTVVTLFL